MADKHVILAVVLGLSFVLIVAALVLCRVCKSEKTTSANQAVAAVVHTMTPSPVPPSDGSARLDAALASLRTHAPGPGLDESALAAREQQLGRPIPAPVRRLLAAVSPQAWGKFVPSIRLNRPADCDFVSTSDSDIANTQPELTRDGPLFIFAAGEYGDGIVVDSTGRVILADHEDSMIVLADSVAAWLERLIAFDGTEYAYVRGEIFRLPPERRRTFLTDYQRLNPDSEWAARQLMALDFPKGHPLGHHVWDRATRRLLPVADAPATSLIQLRCVSQRDIDSVAAAKACVNLMVVGSDGSSIDLSPLSEMVALTNLCIYDIPEVNARQLSANPALADVYFLRCHVMNVSSLAKIRTLSRLRLEECQVDEADMAQFRRQRPETALE